MPFFVQDSGIIFVSVLAVIVILYYLTREEPRETMSYRNTKIIDGEAFAGTMKKMTVTRHKEWRKLVGRHDLVV